MSHPMVQTTVGMGGIPVQMPLACSHGCLLACSASLPVPVNHTTSAFYPTAPIALPTAATDMIHAMAPITAPTSAPSMQVQLSAASHGGCNWEPFSQHSTKLSAPLAAPAMMPTPTSCVGPVAPADAADADPVSLALPGMLPPRLASLMPRAMELGRTHSFSTVTDAPHPVEHPVGTAMPTPMAPPAMAPAMAPPTTSLPPGAPVDMRQMMDGTLRRHLPFSTSF